MLRVVYAVAEPEVGIECFTTDRDMSLGKHMGVADQELGQLRLFRW